MTGLRALGATLLCLSMVWCTRSAALAQSTSVVEAAKRRDTTAVRDAVARRVDVNTPAGDGATALHWAAHWDDSGLADLLLRAGAKVDAVNDLGVTPLSLACANGSAGMVKRLLASGADPNRPRVPVPPLLTCARTGSVDAVQALLAARADANAREPLRDQTALMWAVAQGHVNVARVLIAHGADVQARARVSRARINRANPNDITAAMVGDVSQGGSTPLLFAARHGDAQVADVLLAAGADVNDMAPDGTSALTMAVHGGHTALARLLLDRRANPNIIGSGYSALHAAVLRGNLDVVSALLQHGANVNARVRNGTMTTRGSREYFLPESLVGATPLLLAARFLELDIMRALLAKAADPSIGLEDGTTVLMAAAGLGSQTKLFDRRDRIAVLKPSDEPTAVPVVALALTLTAEVNAAMALGNTALHAAANMNYPEVARMLIARGARLDVTNLKGETPLAVASGDEVRAVLRSAQIPVSAR